MQKKNRPVEIVKPLIVRTLPHDTKAFTQGLLFYNGMLYESTGHYGKSTLRRIHPTDGSTITIIPVTDVFAEGIAIKDNTLVQLTWKNRHAIIYSFPGLQKTGEISYAGQGWGITTDESYYIMSNGTSILSWRDDGFRVIKTVTVTMNGKPLENLNELEYARNLIYANVWFSDFIVEIDPATGGVTRMIDCKELISQAGITAHGEVLNGIAYNKATDTFYCTGKNWPLIFEIKIPDI